MKKELTIGLFGFGTVGGGLFHVFEKGKTIDACIKKICIKNKDKDRQLPMSRFTYNQDDILNDKEINLVVELIDDAEAAYTIVKKALIKGKSVVSGNKKMLACHLEELIQLQKDKNVALLYDASACGSIPIIRNLEEYYDNDLLKSITGILNGSSNFILTKMYAEKKDYTEALTNAQELGFAEKDPSLDVNGFDSLYKLVIIALHSVGTYVNPEHVFNYGISSINSNDISYAVEKGFKIKLIGQVLKINDKSFTLFVIPKLVKADDYIYNVEYEYNGVILEGECYDKQFMFGKGAGSYPTGSAILSDITACMHNYQYEYKKMNYFSPLKYTTDILIEIYLRYKKPKDLAVFKFENKSESYLSDESNFIIGYIKLKNLIAIKSILSELDIFIAATGNYKSI